MNFAALSSACSIPRAVSPWIFVATSGLEEMIPAAFASEFPCRRPKKVFRSGEGRVEKEHLIRQERIITSED